MFRYSGFAPYKGEVKTLCFSTPVQRLGVRTDLEGKQWEIHAIIYGQVCALPYDSEAPWNRTDNGFPGFTRTAPPYNVEIAPAMEEQANG